MALFSELRRRNVFRVALLYVVASWLILQIADVGTSILDLPGWVGRFVLLLLVIGFPLVLVFSWVYEITPEGIKREQDVAPDDSTTAATARKLNLAVAVLLVLALAGIAADRLIPEASRLESPVADTDPAGEITGPPPHSIAVLPFVNMSADAQNGYFSDGLSEELLNLLTKVPELQVAARTSAFSFKDSDADIQEISARLNVAHVLEGSVRKSGDSIRITAQLIAAADGYHLWSETWDRELDDVFAIQDEIAAAVVNELKLTLLAATPTAAAVDPGAYELYLQSMAEVNRRLEHSFDEASRLLTEALAIDPNFADAWAALGSVQINQVARQSLPTESGIEQARASFERALRIESDHARALSGLGWVATFHEWDFEKAARLSQQALAAEPGNVVVLNSASALAGAFGRAERKIAMLEAAFERDPLSLPVIHNLIVSYSNNDQVEAAAELVEHMRSIAPDTVTVAGDDAWITWFRGDLEGALQKFTELDSVVGQWGQVFALHDLGRSDDAAAVLAELTDNGARPSVVAASHAYLGDFDQAFATYDHAYAARDDWLILIREFAFLKPLHADPRWEQLLRKIGISDADAAAVGIW